MGRGTSGVTDSIPYSEFKAHVARGEVIEVLFEETELRGKLRSPSTPEGGESQSRGETAAEVPFRTVRVEDQDLVSELDAAGVVYQGAPQSLFGQWFMVWILPTLLMVLLLSWLLRGAAQRAGDQMLGFGKSRAKLVPQEGTGVTFADVAGCDEAKQELSQMVAFLKNPARFTALGGHIPKGVLLLGPPGTGKTLLARAIAGEAGVPFFSLSGSDFVEMFVGVGAARVRDLFEQAKAKAPCIIFVDEVDAIGRQRGVSMGVVNDEREQTLNQLLAEMDGFENNSGVILLAATNRPEILDRALLRPGRFDRQVVLDSPDLVGREQILKVHVRGKPLAADRGLDEIGEGELLEAVERVVAGPERRSLRIEPEEKWRISFHESGHALVAARVEHRDPVQKITIVPRGRAALGFTMQLPEREHYLRTEEELLDRLTVMLGGRAAEELVLGEASTGAQDDLRTATNLARQMVCVYGMSDRIGLAHCARPAEGLYLGGDGTLTRDCSEQTAREIDEEVRALLDLARDRARAILEGERGLLERISLELLETETLDRERFEELVRERSVTTGNPGLNRMSRAADAGS
jgi:cell division protease FtsH